MRKNLKRSAILLNNVLYLFLLSCFVFSFSHALGSSEISVKKRVEAHLLLNDFRSAHGEILQGLRLFPNSFILKETQIKVLAYMGEEKAMFAAWQKYVAERPEAINNRDLLEFMAWGIIEKGNVSQSSITRAMAMLAAFFSDTNRGVALLHKNMEDTNSFIRGIAVQLAGHLRDTTLRKDVLNLFYKEKVWSVHVETIKAIGGMQIREAKEDLAALIANNHTHAEEKVAAIASLVSMMETADRAEVEQLITSERKGLRLLACEVVGQFDLLRDLDLILPLLEDHSAEVRASVLEVLGLLRITSTSTGCSIEEVAKRMLDDVDRRVAITAAWLLTLHNPLEGQMALRRWLNHPLQDVQLFAASALTSTGKYGFPLAIDAFKSSRDLFVKMNLALGLISQQQETLLACDALCHGLIHEKSRWMWEEKGMFRILSPSTVKHKEEIPQYPEAVNQLVRLEIIQVLAFMRYSYAQQALKVFLKEKRFGVTGIAIALMLTEGDEEALDLVRELLKDEDILVRMQAALILALWGRDALAISELQQGYCQADRDLQERILEGLGRIGDESSIPFLIDRLNEPFQNLRIIAASALLECLNH